MERPTRYLTPEWVEARVTEIAALAQDPEAAHAEADALWAIALEEIAARNAEDPSACADAALDTRRLDFPRWRA